MAVTASGLPNSITSPTYSALGNWWVMNSMVTLPLSLLMVCAKCPASACKRTGVSSATLKDIRAKATNRNDSRPPIAHTDGATTRDYLRSREVPVSEVVMKLPK